MIDNTNTTQEDNLLNELKQPSYSSRYVTNQNTLKSKKLQKEFELEADAKQKAHNRRQSLEDIKNDVIKSIYKSILPFVLILLVIWAICCAVNSTEIKSGVEWLLSTIMTLFVGALIGKHV